MITWKSCLRNCETLHLPIDHKDWTEHRHKQQAKQEWGNQGVGSSHERDAETIPFFIVPIGSVPNDIGMLSPS